MKSIDLLVIGVELDYSRTRVLLNNSDINYVEVPLTRKGYIRSQIITFYKTLKSFLTYKCKLIYISAMNQNFSPSILLLSKLFGKKVISDLLISEYDTLVNDRKLFKKHSLTAYKAFFNDWICVHFANILLCDTSLHKDYFIQKYRGNESKFRVIPVGAEALFDPLNVQKNNFTVLFYGGFSPLHGIETILLAAEQLNSYKNIRFVLVGTGQTKNEMVELAQNLKLTNVEFINHVPYTELPQLINSSDVGLGIFGKSEKAARVIPNKVYQIAACGVPVITLETEGILSLFNNEVDIITIKNTNGGEHYELSKRILELFNDVNLRESIGKKGLEVFNSSSSQIIIQKYFKDVLISLYPSLRHWEERNGYRVREGEFK